MRSYIPAFILLIICPELNGQATRTYLQGQVSFISSQNIYVKFNSTTGISPGDTLFIRPEGSLIPAVIVKDMSSTSCSGTTFPGVRLSVADPLIARVVAEDKAVREEPEEKIPEVNSISKAEADSVISRPVSKLKQKIKGSVSINSYSDISDSNADIQRFRYSLSFNGQNIANSKVSFESYISFKHRTGHWEEVKTDVFNALKIYNLALKYDINKTTHFSFGRKINPLVSSVGPIDGLQFEKSFQGFTIGALIGARPDYTNFGFNSKLIQYGAFIAYRSGASDRYNESSLALMHQMNNGRTDRRFLYFQHSNTLIKDLNLLTTLEADLYQMKTDSLGNEDQQSTFNPTGFYLSLNYRPFRALSISGSYDARKNVIYYETYKTFVERILENDLRQGFRLSGTYRIKRELIYGLQTGYRYMKSDPRPSKNIYSYLTYSRIPRVNISATLSATLLESGFMKGDIYSLNLSRDFFKGKVQSGAGYRYVSYSFPESIRDILHNVAELSLILQPARNISFSFNYEGTFDKTIRYDRLYIQFRKRF